MFNTELGKSDVLILIDLTKRELKEMQETKRKVIESGWSGTGAIGYAIRRYIDIQTRLETLLGKLVDGT